MLFSSAGSWGSKSLGGIHGESLRLERDSVDSVVLDLWNCGQPVAVERGGFVQPRPSKSFLQKKDFRLSSSQPNIIHFRRSHKMWSKEKPGALPCCRNPKNRKRTAKMGSSFPSCAATHKGVSPCSLRGSLLAPSCSSGLRTSPWSLMFEQFFTIPIGEEIKFLPS